MNEQTQQNQNTINIPNVSPVMTTNPTKDYAADDNKILKSQAAAEVINSLKKPMYVLFFLAGGCLISPLANGYAVYIVLAMLSLTSGFTGVMIKKRIDVLKARYNL